MFVLATPLVPQLSYIMANETSHFLAQVQPIVAEVAFCRRVVQQPVQLSFLVVMKITA
jgi:hypothetical protein